MSDFDVVDPRFASTNFQDRFSAIADLEKKLRPEHAPLLRRLLKDPESGIRVRACSMLRTLSDVDSTQDVATLLDDPWHGCRSAAIRTLLKFGRREYLPKISSLVHDPHLDVKTTVMDSLVEYKETEYADSLLPLLKISDCFLDIRAAEGLCELAGSRYLPKIVGLLRISGDTAKARVLTLICDYAPDEYEEELLEVTADRNLELSGKATLILAQRRPETYAPRLIAWLEKTSLTPEEEGLPEERYLLPLVSAMQVLSESGRPESRSSIARLLGHPQTNVAGRAALCLARLGLQDHEEAVRNLATSESIECRLAAGIALLRSGRYPRSEQRDTLEAVEHWRVSQPHSCLRSGLEPELRSEILDALLSVHASEVYRKLAEVRILDRDIQTPDDLKGTLDQAGIFWRGADDGIRFYGVPHKGMKTTLLEALTRTRSAAVFVPDGAGVALATHESAIARWRSKLRG